ncbi:uncharacterized protein [Spinacia oleracea]|uniref:Late embryogenesis abundant protein LEA-2 subgroup domain-containing protein n=1 Tax=Spinacia oleracea TaxID=3562 RepID=A0ABM3RT89_SPIOL|nr:uncharacterized protein LOC110786655 [Spinacia oleracea]
MESCKLIHPHPHPRLEARPGNYVVLHLPFNRPSWDPPLRKKLFKTTLTILALTTAAFLLWPSNPDVKIVRMRTRHVRIHTHPRIAVDVSLDATVMVSNKAVYSMDYKGLYVAIGYRGKELGHVMSGGGHVRAKGLSYVETRVEFVRVEVVRELIYLVEDLAKGFIKFDTLTQVDGSFGLSFFQVPLKAKISCEIVVNLKQQTVTSQNCYPELQETHEAA